MKRLLNVLIVITIFLFFAEYSDAQLVISKYGEGSSNNKFLEITNTSSSTLDLSLVEIWHASNGELWSTGQKLKLSGNLPSGETYVICNANSLAQVKEHANLQAGICSWNGNDAVGVVYNGVLLDAVGLNGENPGTAWNVAGFNRATSDRTIIRKFDVKIGNKGDWYPSAGTNEDDSEWYVFPMNFEYGLGEYMDYSVISENILKANFATGNLNPFKAYDVSSNKSWSATSGSALANGTGQNSTSDDWLISPAMDLTVCINEVLEFYYSWTNGNFDDKDYLKVYYSTNYTGSGSPLNASWTKLPFDPTTTNDSDWGKAAISLAGIDSKNVYIAFRYYSDITGSPRAWSIANVNLGGYFESKKSATNNLKILAVKPEKPIQGVPFSVEVISADIFGVPYPVKSDVEVTLELLYGNGKLSGTLTKTLRASAFKLKFSNLVTTSIGKIKIHAVTPNNRSSLGDVLDPIPMFIDILPKPVLVVDIYPKGHAGALHPPFSVTAKNPDGTTNTSYDKYPITLSISGGSYSGTVSSTANSGVAAFPGLTFNQDAVYTITAQGADISSSSPAIVTIKPSIQFTPLIVPTYFKGDGQFGERIPTWALIQLSNMHPNTLYRFATRGVREVNGVMDVSYVGAGVNIQYDGLNNNFFFTSSNPDVEKDNMYSTFVTDETGSYKLWANLVPTGNSTFNPLYHANVYWRIDIGFENGNFIKSCDLTANPAKLLEFGTYSTEATGIFEEHIDYASPSDIVVLYDADDNPVTSAMVQNEGTALTTPGYPNQGPEYYSNIEDMDLAWAAYLPNDLPSGIHKIEIYDYQGNWKKSISDADGIWSGVDTRNPSGSYDDPVIFNTPIVELKVPGTGFDKLCSGEQELSFQSEGSNSFDLYLSVNNGTYQKIESNIAYENLSQNNGTTLGKFIHYFIEETYSSGLNKVIPLKLKIQDNEHPEVFSENNFLLYDTPVLLNQSDEQLVCLGDDISLYTTASGKDVSYQWYKDGEMINQTTPQFSLSNLQYSNSGVYTCKVSGLEGCGTVESAPIVVYIISAPEITRQPQSLVNAKEGRNYTIDVQVHHKGIIPPYYKDKFQWYKYTKATNDTLPLTNNNYISGATSSILNFTNMRNQDICKEGDFYFVEVEGLCGTVLSDPFVISQIPEVVIKDQPVDISYCPGTVQVVFECTAVAPLGFDIEYQWLHDGKPILDNLKYNGVFTPKLQIYNLQVSDEGAYICQTNLVGETKKVNTKPAMLKLKTLPDVAATSNTTLTVRRGTDVTFSIGLYGGSEPIHIKWFYEGEIIKEGQWDQFDGDKLLSIVMKSVSLERSGYYACEVANDCDIVDFRFDLTVTKWDEANSVEKTSKNGYSLYSAVPNPVKNESEIKFVTPNIEKVQIQLVDAQGKVCANLFDDYSNAGDNTIQLNLNELNLSAGVYHYIMTAGEYSASRNLIILK